MSEIVFTRSGHRINLGSPRKDLILARDIAESLAKTPMYRGATWGSYNVAQHSVLVAAEVSRREGPQAGLYALLHHAWQPYGAESWPQFMEVLHGAFDLDWPAPVDVQTAFAVAHDSVEMTELRQLCTGRDQDVAALEAKGARPLRGMIKPIGQWDRAMDKYADALRVYAAAAQLSGKLPVWGDLT